MKMLREGVDKDLQYDSGAQLLQSYKLDVRG